MTLKKSIIQMVTENACLPAPVGDKSNLYRDLGFDSLSFIALLAEIEQVYAVSFDIMEMELCLELGKLIEAVERKIKECGGGDDQTFADKQGELG